MSKSKDPTEPIEFPQSSDSSDSSDASSVPATGTLVQAPPPPPLPPPPPRVPAATLTIDLPTAVQLLKVLGAGFAVSKTNIGYAMQLYNQLSDWVGAVVLPPESQSQS